MMAEKIKALSAEAMASAGIIGSLPPVVMGLVFVTTPAYIMLLFTDPRGQVMLLGAGALDVRRRLRDEEDDRVQVLGGKHHGRLPHPAAEPALHHRGRGGLRHPVHPAQLLRRRGEAGGPDEGRRQPPRRAARRSRQALAKEGGLRHSDEGLQGRRRPLQLAKMLEDPKVVDKLAQAGFRGPKPVNLLLLPLRLALHLRAVRRLLPVRRSTTSACP
jgi:hypothetical protein